jgi:hypothetical protein
MVTIELSDLRYAGIGLLKYRCVIKPASRAMPTAKSSRVPNSAVSIIRNFLERQIERRLTVE